MKISSRKRSWLRSLFLSIPTRECSDPCSIKDIAGLCRQNFSCAFTEKKKLESGRRVFNHVTESPQTEHEPTDVASFEHVSEQTELNATQRKATLSTEPLVTASPTSSSEKDKEKLAWQWLHWYLMVTRQ